MSALSSLGSDPNYQAYLSSLESQYGIPPGLLAAQQKQESGFDPNAVSPKGAIGIAQFMPETAKQYGIDPTDPYQSAQGQARMLADLGKQYGGDLPSALAAYNWGSGNLDKKGLANAPAETKNYIQAVMGNLPQQPQQGALSKFASAVGNMIVPQAEAADLPEGFVLQDQGSSPPAGFTLQDQQPQQDSGLPEGFVLQDQLLDSGKKMGGLHDQMQTNALQAMGSNGPLFGIPAALTGYAANAMQAIPFSDEAGSALAALVGAGKGGTFGERYSNLQQSQQAMREASNMTQPRIETPSYVPDITPSALGQFGATLALAPVMPGPTQGSSTLMGAIGKGAAIGGAYGGVYGAGDTNSFLPDSQAAAERLKNAASGAAIGGAVGAPLGALGYAMQPKDQIPIANQLRDRAQDAYDTATSAGATFTDKTSQQLPSDIEKELKTTGKMNARLHGDTLSVLGDLKNDASNGSLSLEDLHQYRQLFGDVVNNNLHPNGTFKPDALKADQAIDVIDGLIKKASSDPSLLQKGTPEAIQAWQTGQKLWRQSAQANDIERIINRAQYTASPATSMQTGFKNLMFSKRFNTYDPAAQELIKKAASVALPVEAMRAIGSRLVSVIALGHGNIPGAIAAQGISAIARGTAASAQAARGQAIIRQIVGKSAPPAANFITKSVPQAVTGAILAKQRRK